MVHMRILIEIPGSISWIGKSVAMSDDSKTIATPNDAKLYHFINGTMWSEVNKTIVTKESDNADYAESAVSLSRDGNV